MLQQQIYSDQLTFFQKVRNLDILLIISILALGIVGVISMYSSDGGQFSYYTKSHIIRFVIFFLLMFILSFVRIKFWHDLGYFFYVIVVLLLTLTSFLDFSLALIFIGTSICPSLGTNLYTSVIPSNSIISIKPIE